MNDKLQKSAYDMFNSVSDDQLIQLEESCLLTEKEFTHSVIDLSKREVSPDSDEGKDLVSAGNSIRRFGSKFLNLFKIELSISFAGVTIFHFVLPKVDSKTLTIKNATK